MSAILIKNANIYSPNPLGEQDILIVNDKISAIAKDITIPAWLSDCKTIDAKGYYAVPGFIDGHVHITGGGGEAGFATQVPPVQLSSLISAGITCIGALLGTDTVTRTMTSVLAKAKSLKEEGMSVFMFTGGYPVPSPNITGSIRSDMAIIEEVRGGKIALADHRVTPVSVETFMAVATEARIGGMLCGYPGMLVIHVGDAKEGLRVVFESLERAPHLARHLLVTHINRSELAFTHAVELVKQGGYLDITSGLNAKTLGKGTIKPSHAIVKAIELGADFERVLMSSDGNGSAATYGDDGSVTGLTAADLKSLHAEFVDCVKEGLALEKALLPITKNVADAFSLSQKGEIKLGADADLLLLNKDYAIDTVIARGALMMQEEKLCTKGTFE